MNFTSLKDISENFPLIFYDYESPYTDIILEMYNNPNIKPENYDLENHIILNLIAQYYHLIFIDYENAKKYYLLAITNGNIDSIFSLALYYKIVEKNYEEMIKYYLLTIQYDSVDAIHALEDLADYYYYHDNIKMKKYYLLAIEKDSVVAMESLANYYREMKDYEQMITFYKMAIEHGDIKSIKYLANYYREIKDYEQMIKYYLLAIEHDNSYALTILEIYYRNDLKFYHLLSNLENKSNITIEKINKLLECSTVLEYVNKLNTIENNIQECLICYNNLQHISFSCGHKICINCYCLVNKCYYRCEFSSIL